MNKIEETARAGIKAQVPTVYDKLKGRKVTFQEALPRGSGISAERFMTLAMKAVSDSEALRKCQWNSIVNALLDCAHLGLEPNSPLHEGAIIPRKGVAIFQPEYRGVLKLVWNSGLVSSLDYDRVCENDKFEYERGNNAFLMHKPKLRDRGEVYAYYACAHLIGGGFAFVIKSKQEIEAHRDRFSDAARKHTGPWITDFDAMAYKTVLLELGDKKLPKRTTNEALLFHRVAVAETSGDLPEGRRDSLDLGAAVEEPEEEKQMDEKRKDETPQPEPEPEPETAQFDRREPEPETPQKAPEAGTAQGKQPERKSRPSDLPPPAEDESPDRTDYPEVGGIDDLVSLAAQIWDVSKGKALTRIADRSRELYAVREVRKMSQTFIDDFAHKVIDGKEIS